MVNFMIDLAPNYKIIEKIFSNTDFSFYNAVRDVDGSNVIIKVLNENTLPVALSQFKNEKNILRKDLGGSSLELYEMECVNNRWLMILEGFKAQQLSEVLGENKLSLRQKLQISISLAQGLGEIHHKNVIHKDIKPSNILVNLDNCQIKFLNFNHSSLLNRQIQQITNPKYIEGTLAYMSPEQTGRINCPINYQTDIYSLGVTLYQMFTGKLPFEESDPVELVYKQIAKQAIPPSDLEETIPDGISAIIMKCLSKESQERYHSAFGLKNDLEACLFYLEKNQFDYEFKPGLKDVYDHFYISQKLYGRENELKRLLAILSDVVQGKNKICVIKGYAGIGKSRLVNALQKAVVGNKGYFITGKFDQYQKNEPFSAILVALRNLMNHLLSENDNELISWRQAIEDSLKVNAQLLSEYIPELKLILGEQPSPAPSSPLENENRLNISLKQLLQVFSNRNIPLVLTLDDLQWADDYTLKFLETLPTTKELHHCLVIGSYRDNEVSDDHLLAKTLKRITDKGGGIEIVTVNPLDQAAVEDLIADTLNCDRQHVSEIARYVLKKTHGNPFFINQYLLMIYQEGLLDFNPETQSWNVKMDEIEKTHVTQNVVDMMIDKIQRLPPSSQNTLKAGAAIGYSFSPATLSQILEIKQAQAEQNLIDSLEAEFIIRNTVRSPGDAMISSVYVFQHDRIRQVAYQLIPVGERDALHYKIGRVLYKQTPPAHLEDSIMNIVDQLNYGLSLASSAEEKREIIDANLIAAKRAQKGAIYALAIAYYKNAISLLKKNAWTVQYQLCFELHENLAICEQVNGNINEAKRLFTLLIKQAKTKSEKARIYLNKISLFYGTTPSYGAIFQDTREALSLYGIDFQEHPSRLRAFLDRKKMLSFAKQSVVNKIKRLPFCQDEEINMISEIYARNFYYALYEGNEPLMNSIVRNSFELILKHGLNESSAYCVSCLTSVLLGQLIDYKIIFSFAELTLEIAEKFPQSKTAFDAVYPVYSQSYRCGKHIGKGVEKLLALGRLQYETGNFRTSALSQSTAARLCFSKGDSIDSVLERVEVLLENVELSKTYSEYTYLQTVKLCCLALQGKHPMDCRPAELNEALLSRIPKGARKHIEIKYAWHQLILDYLQQNYEKVIEARHLFENIAAYWPYRDEFYYYYFLSLTSSRKFNWKKLCGIQKMFKKWSEASPDNYLHRYLLICAEMSRLANKKEEAVHFYDTAILSAKKNQFQQDTALAYELLAKYHIEQGNQETAVYHLNQAKEWYTRWGATVKADQIDKQYESLFSASQFRSKADTPTFETFDINTLVSASQALSKEISLEKLVQALMKIVVLNAGADKAYLILQKKEQQHILSELLPNHEKPEILVDVELKDREGKLSISIIHYVVRIQKEVLLHDALHEGIFQEDPYIKSVKPSSILCIPLFNQGKFFGVLYLENQNIRGAFTPQRVHLLNLLSSQIAISVENAQFYSTLEHKVAERTQELSERNLELKETMRQMHAMQEQMIQKEKLASMGLLASGVAHEIQNPLNFIINFSDILAESINGIETKDSQAGLLEKAKQYINKINSHGKRAEKIIKGMLAFDRLGSRHKEKININSLLDKAIAAVEKNDLPVRIDKYYDENLRPLEVYQEDMFTVFKNIVENACDALREIKDKHPPTLEVKTVTQPEGIYISIRDNGPGISEDIRKKIFHPFFTTKQTASRVGLGLSIAYDIISKEHGGEITVSSEADKFTEFKIKLPNQ